GAGNRSDIVALCEQPGQSYLRRCCTCLRSDRLDLIDDPQIALEVFAGETRVGLSPVIVGQMLGRANLACKKAVAERRVGDEPNAKLAQQGQQLGFRVTRPQRVFGLQRGERVYSVCASDRGGTSFGQTYVSDLSLGDQLRQSADGVFDRGLRVDSVLVIQVNAVGAEPHQ